MNRRNFVAQLLAGASGAYLAQTFDVDRFLWVPGAKTIFIPEPVLPVRYVIPPHGIVIGQILYTDSELFKVTAVSRGTLTVARYPLQERP